MSGKVTGTGDTGHAAMMDRMYRYQRHIYDLTRKYYLLGRDRTIRRLDVPRGGSLLEVGCGTGRNLLLAARHFPAAELHGLDISAEMLATAASTLDGLEEKPHLIIADAANYRPDDFNRQGFDRIMISYALSMIPEWEKSLDASLAALNPGGSLHIVDFGQQENLPRWIARSLRAWLARFHVTPRASLREALQTRLARHDASLEFEALYGGYAWRAVITRNSP